MVHSLCIKCGYMEGNCKCPRYCIARDGSKWRVYDDVAKVFAEPIDKASGKAEARQRAHNRNFQQP